MSEINEFAHEYVHFNPEAVARALENFPFDESYKFLSTLDLKSQVSVFQLMEPGLASSVIPFFTDEASFLILGELPPKNIAQILQTKKGIAKDKLLKGLSEKLRKQVEQQGEFLPESAGFFMDTSFIAVNHLQTIENCLKKLQRGVNFSYYLYFIDEVGKLTGVTSLRRLILEKNKEKTCQHIMTTPVDALKVDHNSHEILSHPLWQKFSSLPVVDYQEHFKGVLTYEVLNKIKDKNNSAHPNSTVQASGKALAELYNIGLSALFESASSLPEMRKKDE